MNKSTTSRRRFLVAAITFSGLAGSLTGSSFLRLSSAWAQAEDGADQQMDVLNLAMSATASDGSFAALLDTAIDALNTNQPGAFMDLDEAGQVAALQSVESQPFFAAIQMSVGTTFYYHPAVWALLGYEGPSFDKSGYLHRGSGDIDWLPEGK